MDTQIEWVRAGEEIGRQSLCCLDSENYRSAPPPKNTLESQWLSLGVRAQGWYAAFCSWVRHCNSKCLNCWILFWLSRFISYRLNRLGACGTSVREEDGGGGRADGPWPGLSRAGGMAAARKSEADGRGGRDSAEDTAAAAARGEDRKAGARGSTHILLECKFCLGEEKTGVGWERVLNDGSTDIFSYKN